MSIFTFFKKDSEKEKIDNEEFWNLHKKAIEHAKVEAREKDDELLKKFCPMVDGNCRADCVNFVKAWVSDLTGMWFDDDRINVKTCGPKCKLWESKCIQ